MKKLLAISAIALFGAMNAQKNTILVGGNISYNSSKEVVSNTSYKSNTFSFNPTVGYQFTDNWTAGVRLGLATGKGYTDSTVQGVMLSDSSVETKTNVFSYGVFGRYTMPLSDTFAAYGDLDVNFNNGKVTPTGSQSTKVSGMAVTFTPNLFINFKNSFGLNFNIGGLGYTTEKVKGADYKVNQFGFEFGKGVTVGISKNFGGK